MKAAIVATIILLATASAVPAQSFRTPPTPPNGEIDFMPRFGETREAYEIRTSGNPARIEAYRKKKIAEAQAAAERDALCADRNTTVTSRTYNSWGSSSSETHYRYIPGC